jgi:lysophospholipase L1-like esterase
MRKIIVLMAALLGGQAAAAQQPPAACEALLQERQAMEARLRDWPALGRYRESNARLAAGPRDESRVVFFGDSITEFWNLGEFFPGKAYVNRGISGQTTPQLLLRFRQDVGALKPRVVVILAATNDIAENTGPTTLAAIEDNLMSMAELAAKQEIRVVLASVLPAARYPWKPEIQPVEKILALNAWMKQYAEQEGLVHLDYYAAMAGEKQGLKAGLSEDGVHPNAAGYAVMGRLAGEAIARAMGKSVSPRKPLGDSSPTAPGPARPVVVR